MSKRGIDISCWQSGVDYAALAADVDFVMIRTGYGRHAAQRDKLVETHVRGCEAAGIPYGFYHYSYADTVAKAREEARFMLDIVRELGAKPEYPLAIDFEDSSLSKLSAETASAICAAFCDEIEAAGYYATIYASLSWLTNKLTSPSLAGYDKWVAHWADKCGYTGAYGMWQYTSSGKVAGISGRVDCNLARYDYPAIIRAAELNSFDMSEADEPVPAVEPPPHVYPTAPTKVQQSKLVVGGVEIPTLILDDIMYAPVRETVRTVGSAQMGVKWHDEIFSAEVVLGETDQE